MNKKKLIEQLGKNIQRTRIEKKVSLEILSKQTGIKIQRLQRIEKGEINLRFNTIAGIAIALNTEMKELCRIESRI